MRRGKLEIRACKLPLFQGPQRIDLRHLLDLPYASDLRGFSTDPLSFLATAARIHGSVFALPADGPIYSRIPDTTGVVCVCAAAPIREVLRDATSFTMPPSAARDLHLAGELVSLNRGLHSLEPQDHAAHKPVIANLLACDASPALERTVSDIVNGFLRAHAGGAAFGVAAGMRKLVLATATQVLFGTYGLRAELARSLQDYFFLRRDASASRATDPKTLERVRNLATAADAGLRAYLRWCRSRPDADGGLLRKIATTAVDSRSTFGEDAAVGHANVLFISATEPLAMTLTWTLLLMSQAPALRRRLRRERSPHATARLVHNIVLESLRLFPPNALMVRVTSKPVTLQGVPLPVRCEIIICTFVPHRDGERFDRPGVFDPERWNDLREPPEFLPFGAGAHACAGRSLALWLIETILVELLSSHDVNLAGDQDVDWRMHVLLQPNTDPMINLSVPETDPDLPRARLLGRAGGSVSFNDH